MFLTFTLCPGCCNTTFFPTVGLIKDYFILTEYILCLNLMQTLTIAMPGQKMLRIDFASVIYVLEGIANDLYCVGGFMWQWKTTQDSLQHTVHTAASIAKYWPHNVWACDWYVTTKFVFERQKKISVLRLYSVHLVTINSLRTSRLLSILRLLVHSVCIRW